MPRVVGYRTMSPCSAGTCWPGCLPAGCAGGGWNLPVQRQSRVPVPARPYQRDGARPVPAEEHLYPRGQVASAPARPASVSHHDPSRGPGAGPDVTGTVSPAEVIGYLREHGIAITWNPAAGALQARVPETAKTVTIKAS